MSDKEAVRAAGFTEEALNNPRDEFGLVLLCAFNGIKPGQAPPGWYFHPNHSSAEAWKRVADAARAYLERGNDA